MNNLLNQEDPAFTARALETMLREITPKFSREFNATKDPELKTLLNDITPTLIALCFKLELFAELRERGLKNNDHGL